MVADVLPLVVPAFEMSIASQGMSKGTLQSEGPQFVPRAMVKVRRLQFGGQWRNVSTNSAKSEAMVFAGWSGKTGAFDLGASVAYKMLISGTGPGNRRSWELTGTAARKFGKLGLRASAVYSPDDFGGTKSSFYLEGGPNYDLCWKLKASAAIGIRERRNNRDYISFNAGLSRPIGKNSTADVRYYDTDKGEFGETFDRRVVGSVKVAI